MTWSEEDNRKLLLEFASWVGETDKPGTALTIRAMIDQFLAQRKKGESS